MSTTDQARGIQAAALRAAGCRTIRSEKKSGTGRGARTERQILLDLLQESDTLEATRIDRLAFNEGPAGHRPRAERQRERLRACRRAHGRRVRRRTDDLLARGRWTSVVLACAHLHHDPSDSHSAFDKLAALCQRCHMIHDAPEHGRRRRMNAHCR